MGAPLDDPEERLVGAGVGGLAALGPGDGAVDGPGDRIFVGGQGRAVVEAHGDVGAEGLLNLDRALGGQLQKPAVEVRAEGRAAVGDFGPLGQAEDLKAPGIGEDRAVPAHEFVQAAEPRDGLLAGPER